MSTMSTKNKEKRSRSSSNEANNSFVKNVTSRVSGLLPSTITKWFSSPSTSSANGSAPAADATDSSTEDEAPESPITTQPPSKRMRFTSPGKYNHFPTDVSCVSTNIDNFEQCAPYNNSSIQSPPGRTTFRRETNFVSTPIRPPPVETPVDKSERDNTMLKAQHTLSSLGSSIATKRKSIFDSTNNEASKRACAKTASNTVVDPKVPSFKPSLFGSPFYPGQTVYGGASSTYINQPNIKHRKVAMVNESSSNDNMSMSYSARRVMDLLENYSSPLLEAKRISPYVKSYKNDSYNDSKMTSSSSPYCPKVMSYKTRELHVPNIASVLRLKQKSRLMDTTNAARQIMASHSSTDMAVQTDYVPYPSTETKRDQSDKESSSRFTTKVKSRLTRPKRGETDLESQVATPVVLPTAVLQIDKHNMPKFSFGNTTSVNTPHSATSGFSFTSEPTSKPSSETTKNTGDNALSKPAISKPEVVTNINSFKFSSPVRLSSEAMLTSSTPPKFTFGSPDRSVDKPIDAKKKDDDSSCVVGAPKENEKIMVTKTKDWQCADCWVFNKTDVDKCVCCGGKKPSEKTAKPDKCSTCKLADSQSHINKCVNCEKVQLKGTVDPLPIKKVEDSSKWKCADCWVSNDDSAEKCVCCGGSKPKKSSATPNIIPVDNSLKPTDSTSDWKCDICLIKNKNTVDKCIACGGLKPGSKQASGPTERTNYFGSTVIRTLDSKAENIVKLQSDCWECQICLVKNEKSRSQCVCCEAAKPGTVKESSLKFNFSKTPNTSFLFGIDPKAQENKTAKPAEEKPAEVPKKPEESETNNNTLPKTPSFSFGIPPKKADDQIDSTKSSQSEPSKLNFTFGVPAKPASQPTSQPSSQPSASATTPVFGTANKLSEKIPNKETEESEKLQEVPKVKFTLPEPKEAVKPLSSLFGSPITSSITSDKPVAPVPSLLGSTTTEKKDLISNSLGIQPTVTSIQETSPQNSVTFTAPAKPAVNLFSPPTSTITSFVQAPATTTMSLFQKPETTTSASISLFKKPDVATTSTVSLFQKSDTTTTSAPPPLAATAPIFSFGANATPAAAPQPENSKFNFTFGSGSTKTLFNNSFGSPSTDNNTNKFGFTGNRLAAGGNGLSSGNMLAGGTGLASTKLGTTNELPTNSLQTNALQTNSLQTRNELQQPATGLFGAPVQNENLWSTPSSNTPNLFVSNASSATMQKSPAFTFGTSTPFNASGTTPAFGSSAPSGTTPAFGSSAPSGTTPAFGSSAPSGTTPAFGSSASSGTTPAFGSTAPPAQNMFGMNQGASNPAPLFSTPVQSSPSGLFSSGPGAASPAPALGLFGAGNANATPVFGSPNPALPGPAPALAPSPAPAFNFGAAPTQPTGGIFGFAQQSQQAGQTQPQAGVYSFGGAAAPQVQFNMGSAPTTGGRRVRKAVRRCPQR